MPGERLQDTARRIVADLWVKDRIRLLSGRDGWHVEGLPDAGLPAITVTDGPHGLRKRAGDAGDLNISDVEPATCFPTASALGATWDEELLTEVGRALGREAAAADVAVLLGPGLNIKRHPGGGRNFEYFSEDPVVAGRMAAALVRGIQAEGVGACLKHFAANHQESFRMVIDTVVDERTLRELELTAFEIAVRESQPWTVMTAYNRLGGRYCSDDRWLLADVLRGEWGFDGLVMSDWGGVNDRVRAIRASCDLEMPGSNGAFDEEVQEALRDSTLTISEVDQCAERVVELLLRSRGANTDRSAPDLDGHHELARRVAAAGTVLLTNDGTLPLSLSGTIAVIGAFAETPRFQGAGSSQVQPTRLDAALPALRERAGGAATVLYAPAYDADTGATTDALVAEAVEAAGRADVTVLFAGLPGRYESEGFDRRDLALPDGHTRVIEAVLDANPRTVVVLTNGAPIELPWADRPAALVEGYLGGQAGGSAIVDVLVGDAEPGGRLAESFPREASDLPADDWFPGGPKQVEHREGLAVGYRFHDTAGVPARFPFGHGLSYTTFDHDNVRVDGDGTALTVTVEVTNTGDRAGTEVVQLYVRDVESSVPRPAKELRAFAKVQLHPQQKTTVTFDLDRRAFAVWDTAADDWLVEQGTFELLVGASSTDIRARATIDISSDDVLGPSATPVDGAVDDETFATALGRPVPTPDAVLPFHRNTPVADLAVTPAGRLVQRLILAAARRQAAELSGADEASRRMFDAVVREAPLRSLVLLGGGTPSFRAIDRLIAVLNAVSASGRRTR